MPERMLSVDVVGVVIADALFPPAGPRERHKSPTQEDVWEGVTANKVVESDIELGLRAVDILEGIAEMMLV